MAIVIPYVKQTWTDGSGGGTPVSAARLGVLEEGILDVSQSPAVHVTHNAAQSTTTGVDTALAFNTERYDQAGGASSTMHDTVTNNSRLTAIYAGVYKVSATVEFAANGTGLRWIFFRINGTTTIAKDSRMAVTTGDPTVISLTMDYSFAVNDYVECLVRQSSGGNLNANSTGNYSPEFGMVRIA